MARLKGRVSQRAFLAAFGECASITKAAQAAGVDRGAHYDWLKAVPGYAAQFAEATVKAGDFVEDIAVQHATQGVLKAKWYQGQAVGTERVYAEGTLAFLLRGFKPQKYRQESMEITGLNGGPVSVSLAEVLRERRAKRGVTEPDPE